MPCLRGVQGYTSLKNEAALGAELCGLVVEKRCRANSRTLSIPCVTHRGFKSPANMQAEMAVYFHAC